MFRKNRKLIMAGFGITTLCTILLTTPLLEAKESKSTIAESKLEAYLKFTQILNLIEEQYVDDVNTTTLITKALKGLMTNLDAHSAFLTPKEFKDLTIQTKGEFGGLGIVVSMKNGALTVIAPIDGTPAYKAGVKAGDIILKIDNKATLGMTIDEAVSLMRGKPKTPIELTIVRKGENKPLKIKIIRDIIKIQSVKHKIYHPKDSNSTTLYIKISSFDSHVVDEVKKAVKNNPKAQGYLIDLRDNPGGLLNQATGLLDEFISKGVLVSQKGRVKSEDIVYKAHKKDSDTKTPMVVLVNGGSASASEIVSGALQDHRRAIIVGEKTFGKGSVQVIIPVGKDEGLKLTVARYYLPSGRTIQNKGVTPDILAYPGVVPQENNTSFELKERDLKKHLQAELNKIENENNATKTKSKKEEEDKKKILTQEEVMKDNQLKIGLDILKSLILLQNRK